MELKDPVGKVKGIGPKKSELLKKLKIETVEELNALYEQWVKTKTQSIIKRIEKLNKQLEILQNSVQGSSSVG